MEIKDHRRHLKPVDDKVEAEELEKQKQQPLLQQVEFAKLTGDERLDKLLRAVAAKYQEVDAHAMATALVIAQNCVTMDQFMIKKMEYAFAAGMKKAFEQVSEMPAVIMLEEKGHGQTTH